MSIVEIYLCKMGCQHHPAYLTLHTFDAIIKLSRLHIANFSHNPCRKLCCPYLGCFYANAFSKAHSCLACTGFVSCGGGFRRISKAEFCRPTENGGGESREQCDGINSAAVQILDARHRVAGAVRGVAISGESTHSDRVKDV